MVEVEKDLSQMTCAELEDLLDKIQGEIGVHAHSIPTADISEEEYGAHMISFNSSSSELEEWLKRKNELERRRSDVLREFRRRCSPQP